MKTRSDNAIKWIEELYTTQEKQGRFSLGDSYGGFCCLGLGCYILDIDYHTYSSVNKDFTIEVGLLNDAGIPLDYDSNKMDSLVNLNDNERKSFKEIGVILKSNPHRYFKKDVAKNIKNYFNVRKEFNK